MKAHRISKYLVIIVSLLSVLSMHSSTGDITKVRDRSSLKITGVILKSDGTPAKAASVQLFPSDFNPYSEINLDSVMSDSEGRFTIPLRSAGLYNLYISSKDELGFEGSIAITGNEGIIEREYVLKEPGSVSGTVNLRQEDDNRNAIILVQGTNTYAMPEDSTGTFLIPVLPEGTYKIRILSLIKGYGFYDTSIVVKAGIKTDLSRTIDLPYGIPEMKEVKAVYDKYFMKTTLSWKFQDTSNIRSFYIFRNTSIAEKPFAILSNACTTFTDDVLLSDTVYERMNGVLRYTIAACGRDGSLGKSYTVPDIERRSVFKIEDTVNVKTAGVGNTHFTGNMMVDGRRNIYLFGNRTNYVTHIIKIDSSDRVSAEYIDQVPMSEPTHQTEKISPSFDFSKFTTQK